MKKKLLFLSILFSTLLLLMGGSCRAFDDFYSPMNFASPTNIVSPHPFQVMANPLNIHHRAYVESHRVSKPTKVVVNRPLRENTRNVITAEKACQQIEALFICVLLTIAIAVIFIFVR